MISVDGPPEQWAADVAELLVDRGRTVEQIRRFFGAVFFRGPSPKS